MFQPSLASPTTLLPKPTAQTLLIAALWVTSYLAVDVIKWAGGRSTLISNVAISLPMIFTAVLLTIMLERLCARLQQRKLSIAVPLLGLSVTAAAVAQCVIDLTIVEIAASTLFPEWTKFVPANGQWHLGGGIYIYAVEFLLCLIVMALFRARLSIRRAWNREAELASARLHAEARALRLQLNPHFLFNALNSIAALVAREGNRNADAMICRLSDFLRASLTTDPLADVSLARELATIDAYLAIEKLRLGPRLSVQFDIAPDTWEARIPNFILQPLFENAIKHGLAHAKTAISVRLEVRRQHDILYVAVINRHVAGAPSPKQIGTGRTGLGLSNTRQRLNLFGGDDATLHTDVLADGFRATLRLPFRFFATVNPNDVPRNRPPFAMALEAST